jgi:aspartate/methionine/tyrosine aminotransferase
VLLVNAPNNPTGWTLSREEQQALLAHCRRTGTWIVADEVYERIYFGGGAAPSFLDVAQPDDRLVVAAQLLKSFLMTGWRLGWLVLPADHMGAAGKLLEFNSSCAPVFVQRGGLAALAMADDFVPGLVGACAPAATGSSPACSALPGVPWPARRAACTPSSRSKGRATRWALPSTWCSEHGLGLAPGAAFGTAGQGWLRWCFASRDPARLDAGLARLAAALGV